MAWFIRKSFRVLPGLRINLSRGGLGFSAGVKGARLGVDAHGRRYFFGGGHGLYVKEFLSRASSGNRSAAAVWALLVVAGLIAILVFSLR